MSLTAHRVLQYIALILIFTAMAGGYWYWQSQAAVRINQGLEDSLEQGLVGYWKLDDASGTTATDSSGNGNSGTLTNGPTWSTGQVGGGVTFDGVDDSIVSISNSPQIASLTKATVSFWVNPTQIGGIFNTLQSDFGGNGPFLNGFEITKDTWHGTQTIRLAVDGSVADMQVRSTAVLPLSAWTHVTVVWDGTLTSAGTKFYYNGITAGTTLQESGSGTYVPSDGRFKMGVGAGQLNGSLDEVRVYNRTLSDEEVKRLYQTTAPTGIDTGLVGYWPFDGDDISGTTASDRSGKGNHGTITSGTTKTLGKAGQALDFSAGNGVQIDSLTQTGQTYTFATWAKLTDTSTMYIFDTSDGRLVLDGGYQTSTARSISYYDGTWKSVGSANSIPLNEWVHLVWVLNSSSGTATGYINGVSVGTNSYVGTNIGTNTRIGSYFGGGAGVTQGALDDFRIYNRALTAADVQDLYQKTQSDTVGASNKRDSLALGLAGYWKLDDASGTTATDSSTNGNNGTLTNGPTWTTGQIQGAANFDGVDDYIDAGSPANLDNLPVFSASAWIYQPTASVGYRKILSKGENNFTVSCPNGGWCLSTNGTELNFGLAYASGNLLKRANSGVVPFDQWNHVVVTWDGTASSSGTHMYVNGFEVTYASQSSGSGARISDASWNVSLGALHGGAQTFYGKIDETRIYNRVLTADEISRLYRTTAPTGVDTGLKGYWSFDGPSLSGTTVADWSGASNTGTSSGGPVVAAGPMGQALTFDGVNDCVSVPDAAPLRFSVGGKMSIGLWYKSDISSGTGALYQKIDGSTSNQYAALVVGGASSHTLTFYYRSDGAPNGIDAVQVPNIEKNVWHHVISTYDTVSGVFTVFVDGVSVKTMTAIPAGTGIGSSNVLNIGSGNGCAQNFTGQFDELRVYNRILSVDEVREAYDYGKADKVNTAGSDPLTDGLAGYWKLDDASGTTATDSSGNGHAGTLYNSPTWGTGQVSGGVSFDGTNDYINIPSITAAQFGNTTFTFAGWIKTTGTDKYIAAQDYCNGGWGIWMDSFYKVFVGTRGAGACGSYTVYRYTASAITANEWHHIAAVIKTDTSVVGNNTINIYIDGALNQDTTIVGSSPYGATGANGLQISGRYINDLLFSGPMDELRLYNRGLSTEEVQRLYRTTAPTGVDTGLVGYWSFDGPDVAGTTAYDRSGKGNHGSLVNSPSVIAGKIGQALSFWPNGTDTGAYTGMGDPASGVLDFGTGDFAVGFWMKSSGWMNQGSTANMPFSKSNNDFIGPGYLFKYTGGNQMIFVARNGTTDYEATAAGATTGDGQWHHYIGQRSGSTIYIYVDGALAGSSTVSGSVSTTTGVGVGDDGSGYRNVNGSIDEVRIYNRALTSAEIQNLYNKGR